jgi:hypothetical protein
MAGKEMRFCQCCGGPITGKGKKYCSIRCSAKGSNNIQRARGKTLPYANACDQENQCIYNPGVVCCSRECDTCGWNPVVAEARIQARRYLMNGPCKDCPDRHTACWGHCERYQEWRAERKKEAAAERERKLRDREEFLRSEQKQSPMQRFKYTGGKQ